MKQMTLITRLSVGLMIGAFGGLVGSTRAESAPAKELSIKIAGDLVMEFVLIPAGSFLMGSTNVMRIDEHPQHTVTIAKPFYMGRYVVTQAQWQQVTGNNPSSVKEANLPVDNISWNDCQNFLAALNKKVPNRQFSLPSEAQWEYAARAGSATDYCFGNSTNELPQYAWYSVNAEGKMHPVGQKKPNAWGLYDMHGNVWEWCQDNWHLNYEDAPADDSAWTQGDDTYRVFRGGSWAYKADYLRVSKRTFIKPELVGTAIGVRLVMAAESP